MRKTDVILIIIIVALAILTLNKCYKEDNQSKLSNQNVPVNPQESYEKTELPGINYQDSVQQQIYNSRQNALTRSINLVQPAVVSVNVIKTEIVRRYINPFDNPFFGFFNEVPYRREVQGIGSGIIFSEDGYIITNEHVVEGATKIKVILPDGRQYDGEIIGSDSVHDIAVLEIEADDIPCARLGKSSDLIIGEWAIALGNPYAMLIKDSKPSVSVGVISALERDFAQNSEGKIYRDMIQTDAAINPGNSGGPLVNVLGEVIGINTFIFSESGGSIGIGFAIPIDRVSKLANEIIDYGRVRDIWFGFKVQEITPIMAMYMNLENSDGVIVSVVDENGPAENAGLKRGDIITGINRQIVKNADDAELAVSDIAVGDDIRLDIIRDSSKLEINIKAIEYN